MQWHQPPQHFGWRLWCSKNWTKKKGGWIHEERWRETSRQSSAITSIWSRAMRFSRTFAGRRQFEAIEISLFPFLHCISSLLLVGGPPSLTLTMVQSELNLATKPVLPKSVLPFPHIRIAQQTFTIHGDSVNWTDPVDEWIRNRPTFDNVYHFYQWTLNVMSTMAIVASFSIHFEDYIEDCQQFIGSRCSNDVQLEMKTMKTSSRKCLNKEIAPVLRCFNGDALTETLRSAPQLTVHAMQMVTQVEPPRPL